MPENDPVTGRQMLMKNGVLERWLFFKLGQEEKAEQMKLQPLRGYNTRARADLDFVKYEKRK